MTVPSSSGSTNELSFSANNTSIVGQSDVTLGSHNISAGQGSSVYITYLTRTSAGQTTVSSFNAEQRNIPAKKEHVDALSAYIAFCSAHNYPLDPTADALSFFIIYTSKRMQLISMDAYLSDVSSALELYFHDVRSARHSALVVGTLEGCKRRGRNGVKGRYPLTPELLRHISSILSPESSLDDYLFASLLLTGFYGLLRLGEMVIPDVEKVRDWSKVIKRHTLSFVEDGYTFLLPTHKAGLASEGSNPVIRRHPQLPHSFPDPLPIFREYLRRRDNSGFRLHSELWLTSTGLPPTRSWFTSRARAWCPVHELGSHSMRAGGAMALADVGVSPQLIQAAGRWSPDTFQIYIRKHPVLMQAFLRGRSTVQLWSTRP